MWSPWSPSFLHSSSRCAVVSVHVNMDFLKWRGGDQTKKLGRGRCVHSWWSRSRPALIKLDKEERVFEGPPVDDGLHEVDESYHHGTDEKEGDEGPQVVPRYPDPISQATEPALPTSVGGVAGGIWVWSMFRGLVIRVRSGWTRDAECIHEPNQSWSVALSVCMVTHSPPQITSREYKEGSVKPHIKSQWCGVPVMNPALHSSLDHVQYSLGPPSGFFPPSNMVCRS